MAKSIEGAKRTDLPSFNPTVLVVDWTENHARPMGMDRKAVDAMKASILETGLLQPVGVRLNPETGIYHCAYGFTRTQAMLELCLDGEISGDDKPLKAMIVSGNDEKVEISQITENATRSENSPIENAILCDRLKNIYSFSLEKIAGIFKKESTAWVIQTIKLNLLSRNIQLMVHNGQIPYTGALVLTAVSEKTQQIIIDSCIDFLAGKGEPTDYIPSSVIKDVYREWLKEQSKENVPTSENEESEGTEPTAKKERKSKAGVTRSAKQVKDMLERVSLFSPFANLTLDFWLGTITEDQFEERLASLERFHENMDKAESEDEDESETEIEEIEELEQLITF